MSVLVIADHDSQSIKSATLNTVAAAAQIATSVGGEVAAERARAVGEDRPAGEVRKFAEGRGALVTILEGMRADHDDTSIRLRQ